MNNVEKAYIGIDVSKNHLDVYIRPLEKHMRIKNSRLGIRKFLRFISELKCEIGQAVCEASGGYERLTVQMLEKNGLNIWNANPALVKAFIRSEGVLVKTDLHDAKMIALFAEKKKRSHENISSSQEMEELQELAKRKADFIQMLSSEKTRLQAPTVSKVCVKIIRKHIRQIEKHIETIDKMIMQAKNSNEEWRKKTELMESVPGIGKETSTNLLLFMPELGKATEKQVAALLGVAPYSKESGGYRGVSRIRGGRFVPRKVVYMAALCASRSNPVLKEFYDRLRKRGKKPKIALVAVMRKIIIIVNAMLSKGEAWNPGCYKIA